MAESIQVTVNDSQETVSINVDSGSYVGTVTSVAVSGSDGIDVDSGSPITTSGTIALGLNEDASQYPFVIDEDNMVSDSATKVPTQQSVKAYVDASSAVSSTQVTYATTLLFDGSKTSTFGTGTNNRHPQSGAIVFAYDFTGAIEGSVRTLEITSDGSTITFPDANTNTVDNYSSTLYTLVNNVITLESGKNYFLHFWYTNGQVNIIISDATIYVGDFDAPTFSVAPVATNIADVSFDITATLNENGTVYVVVVANGASAPTSTEVKAGTGSGGSGELATGNDTDTGSGVTISLSGLTVSTDYDVYVTAEDTIGNLQTSPTLVNVATSDYPSFTNTHSLVVDATAEGDTTVQAGIIPNNGSADIAQTYEIWWKTAADKAHLIMQIGDSNEASKIIIAVEATQNYLYFRKRSSSGNQDSYDTTTGIKIADGWNKIVIVDDGLNTATSVKMYKNNTTDIFTARTRTGTYTSLNPIGTSETINLPFNNHATSFGEGKMNLYRQYNAALTTGEITSLGTTAPAGLTGALQAKCILEKRFNNDHTSAIGTDGSAVGSPTFDTDIPS